MQLPDSFEVRCLAGKEPFAGTWLALALEVEEAEAGSVLSFAFGPAREDGRLILRREDVLAQGRHFEEAVGLDYGRLEERWNGRGWVSVAGAAELRHQFRLTFSNPPPRQATIKRLAAARALRALSEGEDERFSVEIETRLQKGISIQPTDPPPGDWLPETLREPVWEILMQLGRRELRALVESGAASGDIARRVEAELRDYGVTPATPPDIGLLLASAKQDGEGAWTIEAPIWTREEGPCDLVAWIHAREREYGLELELRGLTLS